MFGLFPVDRALHSILFGLLFDDQRCYTEFCLVCLFLDDQACYTVFCHFGLLAMLGATVMRWPCSRALSGL